MISWREAWNNPFGAVSEEEAAIMAEILDGEPPRPIQDAIAGVLQNVLDVWNETDLRDAASGRMPYRDYLQTTHWQVTRRRALLRAGRKCQRCETRGERLDVHHLTYARLGREAEADLTVLCAECHRLEHAEELTP